VWELVDPLGSFVGFLGDAQRLPGGNTLVTWSNRGEIVEYTPEGEAVWRLSADVSYGRAVWVPSLTP
jgi:hypothetical protein